MRGSAYVVVAARAVRIAVATSIAILLVAFLAVQSFTSRYGAADSPVVRDVRSSDDPMAEAVAQQESTGRTCSTRPSLTDVVLLQRATDDLVTVVTFGEALAESAERQGAIRRYCV
ncbi:MAG: hypothetical protein JWP31_1689 [Aeromicrobium sp.]|nr:hypothetical protein [Aeromicrobium sp.]